MKKIFLLILLFTIIFSGTAMAQNYTNSLYEKYDQFKERKLTNKRVSHNSIVELIKSLDDDENFKTEQVGTSIEGREIYLVKYGKGSVNVFCWSQMHGDESTATMALFDLFNFLQSDDEQFEELKELISEKITLNIVPMLNPDGAARFTRRNALGVDLNRDARRLASPEAEILRGLQDKIKPVFGFNLHDQSTYYSSGISERAATISFLAPAFNFDKEMNLVRTNTMKLIGVIDEALQKFIPGHTGRYNDDFEPRAFGDGFVKWGTSSVLIESGGWKNDDEKQFIRKLNFLALLTGFESIAKESYETVSTDRYWEIPENESLMHDLILRDVNYDFMDKEFLVDVGIKRYEIVTEDDIYHKASVSEFGDMSIFFGYEELDCTNLKIKPGKIYPEIFDSLKEVATLNFIDLLKDGYTSVRCKEVPDSEFTDLPLNIISAETEITESSVIKNGTRANFVLYDNDDVKYVVVNGYLVNPVTESYEIKNSLIYK